MKRFDYYLGMDKKADFAVINAGLLDNVERNEVDAKHHIVFDATPQEVALLQKGLGVLRHFAEIDAIISETPPETERTTSLLEQLSTPIIVPEGVRLEIGYYQPKAI